MSLSVKSVLRGYHEYKDTEVSEASCRREPTNQEDQFAVVVTKDSTNVGTCAQENIINLFIAPGTIWKHQLVHYRK